MPTLHHPTLPDVTLEVDDDLVERATAQGWTKSETKAAKKAAEVQEKAAKAAAPPAV